MKRYIIIALVIACVSCTKHIEDLNDQTKKPTGVPPASLFANAEKNLVDIMTTPSVNYNIFRLNAQYWTETTYNDESNYDLTTRNIPQSFWNSLYRDVLYNLKDAKRGIPQQDPQFTTPEQIRNELAIADILQVYAWSVLVNTFGHIPYSQALDIDAHPLPVYDSARAVYYDLFTRLDTSINALETGAASFGSSDIIYGGDVAKWLVFANSLKLKLGLIVADFDPVTAKKVVEAAAPYVMTSANDNAALIYKESPPNTNPIWVELVQSGRHDFVIGKTFVDNLVALNDPRVPLYFTADAAGGYSGGVIGGDNKYSTFSKPLDRIQEPTFEALLLDYAEVELLLAEAAARGFAVGGTTIAHYNAGVTASIVYWGGSEAQAADYLATTGNYATLPGTYKQKIGLQKWIALYNRGFDAWTDIRRFDYPVMETPEYAISGYPQRYTYPAQEETLNTDNYDAASAALGQGGDAVSTKLFWDLQ
ncbi:Starch-binding associating with outer membrane [Filimonas lacunae]|uniref:Starch-binding associating with outer membrane n=1 Tax=Filimonas lacunae TaxID=477680 RepID=A0A173MM18_9BACT|nr:SusD/RagB family nutrient-binding outer membrane lipoprotein [Filimonas lacunae]BAV08428.1 hypothetical protein FLA_4469 [Filimonas lacunae]SIT33910.1 Starch-binding associating with outer membrane [Filimonas lacunae]